MAYIEKRVTKDGKTHYRLQIKMKGYPTYTETFHRESDAKKKAKLIEAAMFEGRHFKNCAAHKHTVRDLIERYEKEILPQKPKAKQERQYAWWKHRLGDVLLKDLSPPLLVQCRDELLMTPTAKGKKRSPSTVVRYMAALSHALSIAVREWHWIDDSPMRRVTKPKEPRGRVRFLSCDERKRLLKACKESSSPYLYTIVILSLATGMRQGEILRLRWQDVDLVRGRMILHETKNGERRSLPLCDYALEVVKKMACNEHESTALLFPSKRPLCNKPYDMRSAWKSALKVAGIENFRPHDMRHCAASELAMSGASLAEIAEVLGHKTLQMVKRYSHLSETHTASVVEKMNSKIFEKESG